MSKKIDALARISQLMRVHTRSLTRKTFIIFEFGYCQLVRTFHGIKLNSRVNKRHERTLRIFYQDYESSFTVTKGKVSNYT